MLARVWRWRVFSAEGQTARVDEATMRAEAAAAELSEMRGTGAAQHLDVWGLGVGRLGHLIAGVAISRVAGASGVERVSVLVVVECGAGSGVPTVRHTCEMVARKLGGTLIRINTREPQGPPGTISLPLGAREALEGIAHRLR